jgi:cbb3-type cytochrome oxidase maturation protein
LLSALAVVAFAWSVREGQLDDRETPAERALLDDESTGDSPSPERKN